ncbi:MAG TPA: site-specific DNA-methyltransferase [Candidatus Corynebacterium gallistercoris]|uniref:Site-specific DNA-methyltransferase n=1 Tax=Candidatus Corynebacterium gallistercoris TaxID=2838530 RepID=A0A9D1RXP9_9CORY|nr:site-specific DNA-methyltransferase [Candidatus Corynebacterium gallistercoris]
MAKQRLQLTWYNKDKALIPTETGKYGYTWVDPADPRYCETHTLVMDDYVQGKQTAKADEFEYSERADLEPQDDNLLLLGESGDVLEALTRVPELAEKYVGKVKLIYIDPPFNTAQTFANYEDNLEHSVWLTMMRDRLLHLKKLLADDGSIWVHLDDVESHRMRSLLDEVFGANCFVAEIAWLATDSSSNNAGSFSKDKNLIYVYGRNAGWRPRHLPDPEKQSHYRNPDGDPRGPWYDGRDVQNPKDRPSLKYEIPKPSGGMMAPPANGWRWDRETMYQKMAIGEVYFNPHETALKRKTYLWEQGGLPPSDAWLSVKRTGSTRGAKNHLKLLFPGLPTPELFDTPKPEHLLNFIIDSASTVDDIVLDVFAGSGTTAAVAQKMGRRWVTCELREDTFNTFTRPRLEKVVHDQDPGGITRTKGERVAADGVELPEGLTPDQAAAFNSALNKLIKDDPALKKDQSVKALKAASKTKRTKDVVNWRGGGGFQVAHLSPSCFDYIPEFDRVILTPEATGETLVTSVAANLGFRLLHAEDDYVFDARRGNSLLKVIEGVATIEQVDWLVSQIQDDETIVLAATSVMDGVRQHLRRACKGSRVVAIPDDIFRYSQGGDM